MCVWPKFAANVNDWEENESKLIKLFKTCPCYFSELYQSIVVEREIAENQILTCLIVTTPTTMKYPNWDTKSLQVGDMITVTPENIEKLTFASQNESFIIAHIYNVSV